MLRREDVAAAAAAAFAALEPSDADILKRCILKSGFTSWRVNIIIPECPDGIHASTFDAILHIVSTEFKDLPIMLNPIKVGQTTIATYLERLVCMDLTRTYSPVSYIDVVLPLMQLLVEYGHTNVHIKTIGDMSIAVLRRVYACAAVTKVTLHQIQADLPAVPVETLPISSVTDLHILSDHPRQWTGGPLCHPSTLQKLVLHTGFAAPDTAFLVDYLSLCANLTDLNLYVSINPGKPWSMEHVQLPNLKRLVVRIFPKLTHLPPLTHTPLEVLEISACHDLECVPPVPPTLHTFRLLTSPDKTLDPEVVESLGRAKLRLVHLQNVKLSVASLCSMLASSAETLAELEFLAPYTEQLPPGPFSLDRVLAGCQMLEQLSLGGVPCPTLARLDRFPRLTAIRLADRNGLVIQNYEQSLSLRTVDYPGNVPKGVVAVTFRNALLRHKAECILLLLAWQNRLSPLTHRVPLEIWCLIFRKFF